MNRKRKALSALAVLLTVIFTAPACSAAPESETNPGGGISGEEEKIQIGLTFDTFVLERWTRDRDVFVDTASKLGATVTVQTANGDVEKQKEQIRNFIEGDMDAIVIVAVDCYSLQDVVEEAKEQGIKVVSYDRLIQNCETDLYITVDNEMVGILMAQSIKENLPAGGNIVMICGPEADSNSKDVVNGFEEEIEGGPWEVIYKSGVRSWAAENGVQAVEDAFDNTSERIDAIMCGNDGLAGYVIRSLSERQMAGEVAVVGQDADLEACQRIVEGTQFMTVYKPINDQARKAAEFTVKLRKGEQLIGTDIGSSDVKVNAAGQSIPYYGLLPVAVTAENIDAVIVDSGFHSREEVYLNVEK